MVRSQARPELKVVYDAAKAWVDVALRDEGSLFEPDRHVWSLDSLEDLYSRFNENPDESSARFEDKFRGQLAGAPTATFQLAAELVFVHFLGAGDIGYKAKRRLVDEIISWSSDPIEVPERCDDAMRVGVVKSGIAFKTYRPNQLWYLVDFCIAFKRLPDDRRTELLDDPWAFAEFARAVPHPAADSQLNVLVHLVFPEVFEDCMSKNYKRQIVEAFAPVYGIDTGSGIDHALFDLRRAMSADYGLDYSYYEEPLVDRWKPSKTKEPAKDLPIEDDSDLETASQQRAWIVRGKEGGQSLVPEWVREGHCSIGWDAVGEVDPGISRKELVAQLRRAYPEMADGSIRNSAGNILRFLQSVAVGDIVVAPDGSDLFIGTVAGPPEYDAARRVHRWRREVEWADPDDPVQRSDVSPSLYSKLRTLLTITEVTDDLAELQDLARVVPAARPTRAAVEAVLVPANPDLAASLFVPLSWLDEQIALLKEKRQLIFYGPPGTGKTYLAKALADHLTNADGTYTIVQFHPSYAYEDFFEGFRPRSSDDGSVAYELVPGPLRRLAEEAHNDPSGPYVLIVDEINRANVAKVFGELYFLLEYRDEAITLQYSPDDEFQLPKNLYVIGTMNTVDRSIALVDSALRRRFYFTGLFPERDPVRGMLAAWLADHGASDRAARLLGLLNSRIDDPDAAIGPSFFMVRGIDEPDVLERVWEHSVLPQLEEYHFGSGLDVAEHYALGPMLAALDRHGEPEEAGEVRGGDVPSPPDFG